MASQRICSVEGCGKPQQSRGWCRMHYHRAYRHGDPTVSLRGVRKPARRCSVDGCDLPHKSNGYCNRHYLRWSRHGDPLSGSTGWGEVRAWLDNVAVPYAGDNCLTFPYSTDRHGYGRLNIGGKYVGAHAYVAERCHGDPPSMQHEVCHRCGNGASGCVTPKHLYWGTRRENVHDAIAHGTFSPPPIGRRGARKR